MKKVFLLVVVLIFSASFFAPRVLAQQDISAGFDLANYGVKIEPDRRLMAVLMTLEAGDVKTTLSAEGNKFRQRLQTDLQDASPLLKPKIKLFVEQHRKRRPQASEAEIVAPFVSMAYTLSPAPDLADPVVTGDLPGELLDVLDFAPLVRELYGSPAFAAKFSEYVKLYQTSADAALRASARQMVSETLDYLHTRPQLFYSEKVKTQAQKDKSKKTNIQTVETKERERRFFIVPEMLLPAGNVNFLNIRDDYYAIVSPDTDLSSSDVRRGFLQFVFDPLVLNNAKDIAGFRPQIKTLLDERRKSNPNVSPDVYLAVSRSLVAAADARQTEFEKVRIATAQARRNIERMKTKDEKLAVTAELDRYKMAAADETALQLSEAYEKGAVLSFYFADQLKGLEDSGFDVASSMREMILSLDASKEINRLEQFAEARKRGEAGRKKTVTKIGAIENPVTLRLLEIQKNITAKKYAEAQTELRQLLKTNPNEPRIFYNVGRVVSLSAEEIEDAEQRKAKLLEAKTAFEDAIRSAITTNNKAVISLSYVALARIYEFYEESEYAVKIYDAAIKLGDVPDGAFKEAIVGKERLVKKQP